MKLKLTAEQAVKFNVARKALTDALASHDRDAHEVEALEGKEEQLIKLLDRAVDPLDEEAVELRHKRERQLHAIQEKLQTVNVAELPPSAVQANAKAIQLIRQTLRPALDAFVTEVAKVFAPYFDNDHRAQQAALACDAVVVFSGNLATRFDDDPSFDVCRQTLAFLDSVIQGRNPWLRQR